MAFGIWCRKKIKLNFDAVAVNKLNLFRPQISAMGSSHLSTATEPSLRQWNPPVSSSSNFQRNCYKIRESVKFCIFECCIHCVLATRWDLIIDLLPCIRMRLHYRLFFLLVHKYVQYHWRKIRAELDNQSEFDLCIIQYVQLSLRKVLFLIIFSFACHLPLFVYLYCIRGFRILLEAVLLTQNLQLSLML